MVLDREFSYLGLLEYLVQAGIRFVIRLHSGRQMPTFVDATGRPVTLTVGVGQQVVYRHLRYMGQIPVHVAGVWRKGCAEPLWVMSNLAPEQALRIYAARMKIEEAFRDLKSLLHLDKVMNKAQRHMEQMVALVLLAYTIGLLVGEAVRDALYGAPSERGQTCPGIATAAQTSVHPQVAALFWPLHLPQTRGPSAKEMTAPAAGPGRQRICRTCPPSSSLVPYFAAPCPNLSPKLRLHSDVRTRDRTSGALKM